VGVFFWTQCKPTCQLRLYCPMWLNRNYTFWQTSTTLITIKIIIIIIIRNPPAFLAVMANALTASLWFHGKGDRPWHGTWQSPLHCQTPIYKRHASSAGAAAEMAASRKQSKYTAPPGSYLFQPTALETLGPINESAVQFLNNLGLRIASTSAEDNQGLYLSQRLSIALQRYNAILLHESFVTDDDPGY